MIEIKSRFGRPASRYLNPGTYTVRITEVLTKHRPDGGQRLRVKSVIVEAPCPEDAGGLLFDSLNMGSPDLLRIRFVEGVEYIADVELREAGPKGKLWQCIVRRRCKPALLDGLTCRR